MFKKTPDFRENRLFGKTMHCVSYLNDNSHVSCAIDLPAGLINLEFGDRYNQPTIFPEGLQRLWLGRDYNQTSPLPENLIELDVNHEISITLPPRLQIFNKNYSPEENYVSQLQQSTTLIETDIANTSIKYVVEVNIHNIKWKSVSLLDVPLI